jgi:hypothetical protein
LNGPAGGLSDTNISIIGNTVNWLGSGPDGGSGNFLVVVTNGVQGLLVTANRVDAALTNLFVGGTANYAIYDNYDLNGNYLTNLNKVYLGPTPVSSFGLDLVGANSASEGLTSLGLSSNLDEVGLMSDGSSLSFGGGSAGNNSLSFGDGEAGGNSLSFGTNTSSGSDSYSVIGSLAFSGGAASDDSLAFDGGFADYESLAFGFNHSDNGEYGQYAQATYGSMAFGANSAYGAVFAYATTNSLAIGSAMASTYSFAQGGFDGYASAYNSSFAWGGNSYATNLSFALGPYTTAENESLSFYGGQAYNQSIALGQWSSATNGSFAVAFVNSYSSHAQATNFQWVCAGFTNGYTFRDGPFAISNNLTASGLISGNSLSTTLSNTAPPTAVTLTASAGTGVSWTNSTSENIVAYVGGFAGNIGYNGWPIFTNVTSATVMLQPNSYLSVTNMSLAAVNAHVNWHPF